MKKLKNVRDKQGETSVMWAKKWKDKDGLGMGLQSKYRNSSVDERKEICGRSTQIHGLSG